MVIEAADPRLSPDPAEATQAAPISAIDADAAVAPGPPLMSSRILRIAVLPMIPDGIPVRGGEGAISVPFGDLRGFEI